MNSANEEYTELESVVGESRSLVSAPRLREEDPPKESGDQAVDSEIDDQINPGTSCKCSESEGEQSSEEEVSSEKEPSSEEEVSSEEEPLREERRTSTASSREDVSQTDEDGRSPLHCAAEEGDPERVRELIGRGADTRLRDRWGRTPLHSALHCGREAAAELLVAADSGMDVRVEAGCTPLHLAAENGYLKTIGQLLAGGWSTRILDEYGRTPLHCALQCWQEAAAELLAGSDCGMEVRDEDGMTPLHLATIRGFRGVVRKIVQSGTNPHVQATSGKYPIQLALVWRRNDNIPGMILSSYALKGIAIDREKLRLREDDLQFCVEALSRCDAEIRLMTHRSVPGSSLTYLDLVTRHVSRVASRLPVARGISRSSPARRYFPVYADLIVSKLRAAEERRVRTDGCLECFSLLSPPLPITCADVIVLGLSDTDLANVIRAVRLGA